MSLFTPATREKLKARVCIDGPSGAGKTYSALQLALGLASSPDKVFFIDTEEGSAKYYSHLGKFQHASLSKPYTAARYLEYMKAAEEAGAEVIVIDSMTHLWSGEGGLLDKHDRIAAQTKNSYTAWRDVTPDHNKYVNAMLTSPAHIIATVRSKQAYEIVENDRGKKVPQKLGLAPEFKAGIEYEFMLCFSVDREKHLAGPSKDRTNQFDKEGPVLITQDTGRQLAAWLNSGVDPAPRQEKNLPETADNRQSEPKQSNVGADNGKANGVMVRQLNEKLSAANKYFADNGVQFTDGTPLALNEGDLKAFGMFSFKDAEGNPKASRKQWTKAEFAKVEGWLRQMCIKKAYINPTEVLA